MRIISIIKGSKTKLLIAILALLVVADGIITRFLITRGMGKELNPFLKTWVMDERFLWAKLVGALLVALILWDMSRWARAKGRLYRLSRVLYILLGFYLLIVLWNSFIIFLSLIA